MKKSQRDTYLGAASRTQKEMGFLQKKGEKEV